MATGRIFFDRGAEFRPVPLGFLVGFERLGVHFKLVKLVAGDQFGQPGHGSPGLPSKNTTMAEKMGS